MQTVTLQVQDNTYDRFVWLLNHFSANEIKILDQSKYISDDEYLRSIDGVVQSIQEARNAPMDKAVSLEDLK